MTPFRLFEVAAFGTVGIDGVVNTGTGAIENLQPANFWTPRFRLHPSPRPPTVSSCALAPRRHAAPACQNGERSTLVAGNKSWRLILRESAGHTEPAPSVFTFTLH